MLHTVKTHVSRDVEMSLVYVGERRVSVDLTNLVEVDIFFQKLWIFYLNPELVEPKLDPCDPEHNRMLLSHII
jgi:hypothetical protein